MNGYEKDMKKANDILGNYITDVVLTTINLQKQGWVFEKTEGKVSVYHETYGKHVFEAFVFSKWIEQIVTTGNIPSIEWVEKYHNL